MEQLSLSVGLREAYTPSIGSQQFSVNAVVLGQVVKLKVVTRQLPFRAVTINSVESVKPDTLIKLQLLVQDSLKAEAQFQLQEFFTSGLQGDIENWILLNTSEETKQLTQVKLWMNIQPKPKIQRKNLTKSLSSGGIQVTTPTPFVGKLETVARQDRECE